jgi:hypothetical protein
MSQAKADNSKTTAEHTAVTATQPPRAMTLTLDPLRSHPARQHSRQQCDRRGHCDLPCHEIEIGQQRCAE